MVNARRKQDGSDSLHETVDHLLLAGFLEGDGKLIAVNLHHLAVAEFLVKHAVIQLEFRAGAGGFGDQLALDGHRPALVTGEASGIASRGEWRLALIETGPGLAVAAALSAGAIGLRALPARRRITGAKRFHIVEARGAVAAAAAPSGAALGLGDLDVRRGQFIQEARRDGGGPGAVNPPVGREVNLGAAAGAGQADMGEAPLLFQSGAALFVERALARKQALLPAGQEYVV